MIDNFYDVLEQVSYETLTAYWEDNGKTYLMFDNGYVVSFKGTDYSGTWENPLA